MSSVRFEEVTFSYELGSSLPALQNVSLSLEPGSLTLVTGASGSGKSTLCRLVAGYAPHQFEGTLAGSVEVSGLNVAERSIGELAEHVGVVFEDPFDQLTGATRTLFDEVAFGLENRGRAPDQIASRVVAALAKVGLRGLHDRHPRELSGGQCQRLAIATVLAVQPTILVLDQPTSQLDPIGSRDIIELVAQMRSTGMTILAVAQELDRWLPITDQLIILEAGRIRAGGRPRPVLTDLDGAEGVLIPEPLRIWNRLRDAELIPPYGEPPLELEELAALLREAISDG